MSEELKALGQPCWTCRGRSFAKVHGLDNPEQYRCVQCKAIYPDFALAPRPTPHPIANAGEAMREAAIERASKYVLDNSRRSNASLNDEQRDHDTSQLMKAYRDIIGKALDSGELAALIPSAPEGDAAAMRESAAKVAECAFDDRPRSRSGHHSEMDWTDGYRDGTRAAAAAIRALPLPANVQAVPDALSWLADRDNLILFNGVQPDGWWEVRRGSVTGEIRGRGPTPLGALDAAMIAASKGGE